MKLVKVSMLLLAVVVIGVSLGAGGTIVGGWADDYSATQEGIATDDVTSDGFFVTFANDADHADEFRDEFSTQVPDGPRIQSLRYDGDYMVYDLGSQFAMIQTTEDGSFEQIGTTYVQKDRILSTYPNYNGYPTVLSFHDGVITETVYDDSGIRETNSIVNTSTSAQNVSVIDGDYGAVVTTNAQSLLVSGGAPYTGTQPAEPIPNQSQVAFGDRGVLYQGGEFTLKFATEDGVEIAEPQDYPGLTHHSYDPLTQTYMSYDREAGAILTYNEDESVFTILANNVPTNMTAQHGQYVDVENGTLSYYSPTGMGTTTVEDNNHTIGTNYRAMTDISIDTGGTEETITTNASFYDTVDRTVRGTTLEYNPIITYTHTHGGYETVLSFDSISKSLKNIIDAIPFIMFVAILLGVAISVKD